MWRDLTENTLRVDHRKRNVIIKHGVFYAQCGIASRNLCAVSLAEISFSRPFELVPLWKPLLDLGSVMLKTARLFSQPRIGSSFCSRARCAYYSTAKMSTGKTALLIGEITHSRKEWEDVGSLATLMVRLQFFQFFRTSFVLYNGLCADKRCRNTLLDLDRTLSQNASLGNLTKSSRSTAVTTPQRSRVLSIKN